MILLLWWMIVSISAGTSDAFRDVLCDACETNKRLETCLTWKNSQIIYDHCNNYLWVEFKIFVFYKIFSILQAIKCSKKKQPKNNKKDNDNNNDNNHQKLISDFPHTAAAASAIAKLNNCNTAAVDATILLHGKQQSHLNEHDHNGETEHDHGGQHGGGGGGHVQQGGK